MEFNFENLDETPLVPDQVRIQDLSAEIRPDKTRVRVKLRVSAFQERPSGEIIILNQPGDELASVSFIEAISPTQEFTLHLRGELINPHIIQARIYYLPETHTGEPLPEEFSIHVIDEKQIELIIPL